VAALLLATVLVATAAADERAATPSRRALTGRLLVATDALRDPRFADRFARLWATGRVVTAAGYLGLPDAPLESRRNRAWASARKPPARAREPRARIPGSTPRRFAKGGFTE